MSRLLKVGMGALAAVAMSAHLSAAADLDPPAPIIEHKPISAGGGFYLRGDIGYSRWKDPDLAFRNDVSGITNVFENTDGDDALVIGGGVGYKFNKYLRTDLTFDIRSNKDITGDARCGCVPGVIPNNFEFQPQSTTLDLYTFFANAYLDGGTYAGFTPYIGGGVGFAYVNYGSYTSANNPTTNNTGLTSAQVSPTNPSNVENQLFSGENDIRFAWNLQAGASYEIANNLALDGSYRYTRVANGDVSNIANVGFVEETRDLVGHEFRLGLRYTFGGGKKSYGGNQVFK
ncbi:MAG: outer membrane beta-barrel protein [Hyphomicrobiales bacterium]